MINENRLLNEGNSFSFKEIWKSFVFIFTTIIKFPDNKEYQIYALFCDIASEDEQKAMSLYDYFTVVKDENLDEAVKICWRC